MVNGDMSWTREAERSPRCYTCDASVRSRVLSLLTRGGELLRNEAGNVGWKKKKSVRGHPERRESSSVDRNSAPPPARIFS